MCTAGEVWVTTHAYTASILVSPSHMPEHVASVCWEGGIATQMALGSMLPPADAVGIHTQNVAQVDT